jgi:dihydroorotate dehydrogenase
LDDIIEIVVETKLAGVVATNTTISRANLTTEKSKVDAIGNGGLSGKPLTKKSTEIIKYIHQQSNGTIPIIAVGGIMTADDAIEKLNAGASLVQLYTGFIYEGPDLIKEINKRLEVNVMNNFSKVLNFGKVTIKYQKSLPVNHLSFYAKLQFPFRSS